MVLISHLKHEICMNVLASILGQLGIDLAQKQSSWLASCSLKPSQDALFKLPSPAITITDCIHQLQIVHQVRLLAVAEAIHLNILLSSSSL